MSELIEKLKALPQDAEVYVPDWLQAEDCEPRAPQPELQGDKVIL